MSPTLNIELSPGSSFETRSEKIKKYNTLLENFASGKGYKLAKGKPEVLRTDLDAFKAKLAGENFEIVQEDNEPFYKITKGNSNYLAYIIDNDLAFKAKGKFLVSFLSASLFGVTTTITIKRMY